MSKVSADLRAMASVETSVLFSQRSKLTRAADALDAAENVLRKLTGVNEVLSQIVIATMEEDGISSENGDREWFAERGAKAVADINAVLEKFAEVTQ